MLLNPLYKLLAGLLFILITGVSCYYEGYSSEHDKFVTFKAQVTQESTIQLAQNKIKEDSNAAISQQTKSSYDSDLLRLSNALDQSNKRLLLNHASAYSMSKASTSTAGTNVAQPEPSTACEGSVFYTNSLNDALKLEAIQSWITQENLNGN